MATVTTIYAKTLADGRTAEFRIEEGPNLASTVMAFIDGKWRDNDNVASLPASRVKGDITHSVAGIGLTDAEAANLRDAITAGRARHAQTADAVTASLRADRARLISLINSHAAEIAAARARAADGDGGMMPVYGDATDADLRAQLAAFDGAHPAIAAALAAEQADRTRRAMEID